jgi:hypothetical protein
MKSKPATITNNKDTLRLFLNPEKNDSRRKQKTRSFDNPALFNKYFAPTHISGSTLPKKSSLSKTNSQSNFLEDKHSSLFITKSQANETDLPNNLFLKRGSRGHRKSNTSYLKSNLKSTINDIYSNILIEDICRHKLNPSTSTINKTGKHSSSSGKTFNGPRDRNHSHFIQKTQKIVSTNSPINIFNIKNYNLLSHQNFKVSKRAKNPSDSAHDNAGLEDRRSSKKPSADVRRNIRDFFRQIDQKGNGPFSKNGKKPNTNFEHLSKFEFENVRKNFESEKKVSLKENMEKINQQLRDICGTGDKKSDKGTQKPFKKYYEVNFANCNIGSLVKDMAKQILLRKYANKDDDKAKELPTPRGTDVKSVVFQECLSMTQEQIFFEELLLILNEKGVDLENLFSYCYERLKINVASNGNESAKSSNYKILSESLSYLNSEFSIREEGSPIKLDNFPKKLAQMLQLDFDGLENEVYTSDGEDQE